ncbi:hypothetical protein Pth03_07080 [Planotetraspora thailandica]|uniref:Uncharacterized protein n=1 Tax=Planotetraspora thailandica TaxID=487172 RepID=A0A8J3V1F8_9ACTN|nr:hypothetical protein Pth03_07080 [Planotetraspora thailandica]
MKSSKAWLWAAVAILSQVAAYLQITEPVHGSRTLHAISTVLALGVALACAWRAGRESANRGTAEPSE